MRGLPNPFFAFIPFFQLFMLGQIGDSMKHLNRRVYDVFASVPLAYALPIVSVAAVLLRYPFSTLADLLVSVGTLVVYYLVFYFYARKQCVLFTVIAGLPTIVSTWPSSRSCRSSAGRSSMRPASSPSRRWSRRSSARC